MKKIAMGTLLLFTLSGARDIGLNALVESAKAPKLLLKMMEEESLAFESSRLANSELSPLTVSHSLSYANGRDRSGAEFDFSFSKELKLGNIQELEKKQSQLSSEAYLIDKKRGIVNYENSLKNLYHQYCLERSYLTNFEEKFEKLSLIYNKKKRAYEEDEIAKTELLQLELEKRSVASQLDALREKVANKKDMIFNFTTLESSNSLSCQDLYPIEAEVMLSNTFSLTNQAYEKQIESTQVGLKRYSKKLESIEISTGYAKELDQDVYTIGFSLPLNLSSNKSEYEKAKLLHESSARSLENEQNLEQKENRLKRLKSKLKRVFNTIEAQKESISDYETRLLPLMKKSYDYGESSVVEYLLSQQRLYTFEERLLADRKEYYSTLFEIYSVGEIKESR